MTKTKKAISTWLTFALMTGIISALTVSAGAKSASKAFTLGTGWNNLSPSSTVVRGATQVPLNKGDRLAVNLTFAPVSGTFPNNPGRIDFGMVNVATGVFTFFDHYTSRTGGSINSDMVVPAAPANGMYVFAVRNMLGAAVKITGGFTFYKPNDPYSKEGGLANRTVTIQRIRDSSVSAADWDDIWTPLIWNARDSWNSSGAGVNITTTTGSSPHKLSVGTFPLDVAPGSAGTVKEPQWSNVPATSSHIRVDINRTGSTASIRQSVIAHEMGHLFWLGDFASNSYDTIMNQSRDRTRIMKPQIYDVNNVKFGYD